MSRLIRNAKPDDAAEIERILLGIIDHGGLTALTKDKIASAVCSKIPDYVAKGVFIVAQTDRLIGFQYMNPYPGASAHVGDIATFAEIGLRKTGIGRAMFEETKRQAREKGFRKITARIRGDNTDGRAYYPKMGFREVGIYKDHTRIDGKFVDQVLTEYLL